MSTLAIESTQPHAAARVQSSRVPEIDSIKCLAIIGVLFAHAEFTSRFQSQPLAFVDQMQWLFGWCVLAFFFCSGYLSRPVKRDWSDYKATIAKKFYRLIIPCIAFSLMNKTLLLATDRLGLSHGGGELPTRLNEVASFLLMPVGPQFYFLLYLFVISWLLISTEALRGWLTDIAILLALATMFAADSIAAPPYGPSFALLPAYMFSYQFGYLSRLQKRQVRLFAYLVVLAIASAAVNWMLIYTLVPIVLLLAFRFIPGLQTIERYTHLGKHSGAIYGWHAPIVMPAMSLVAVRIVGGGFIALAMTLVFTSLVSIALGKLANEFSLLAPLRI